MCPHEERDRSRDHVANARMIFGDGLDRLVQVFGKCDIIHIRESGDLSGHAPEFFSCGVELAISRLTQVSRLSCDSQVRTNICSIRRLDSFLRLDGTAVIHHLVSGAGCIVWCLTSRLKIGETDRTRHVGVFANSFRDLTDNLHTLQKPERFLARTVELDHGLHGRDAREVFLDVSIVANQPRVIGEVTDDFRFRLEVNQPSCGCEADDPAGHMDRT